MNNSFSLFYFFLQFKDWKDILSSARNATFYLFVFEEYPVLSQMKVVLIDNHHPLHVECWCCDLWAWVWFSSISRLSPAAQCRDPRPGQITGNNFHSSQISELNFSNLTLLLLTSLIFGNNDWAFLSTAGISINTSFHSFFDKWNFSLNKP